MRKICYFVLVLFILSCAGLKEAQNSFDAGHYDETIKACLASIQADSTKAAPYYLLSRAYFAKGNYDSSLQAIESALVLSPDEESYKQKLYEIYSKLGDDRYEKNEFKQGLAFYNSALEIRPKDAVIIEKIGDSYFQSGKHELALKEYKKISPSSEMIAEKIQNIQKAETDALEQLELGVEQLKKKRWKSAEQYFNKALEIKPDYKFAKYQVHLTKGLLYFKKGSVGTLWDAIEQFGLASALFPEKGEPHYHMGLAYHKKDKEEYFEAIREFETAASVEPNGEYSELAIKKAKELKAYRKKMKDFWGK